MGLMRQAYETYRAMEAEYAGKYIVGQKEPLAPVSHMIVKADLEITLDETGTLINAVSVNGDEAKTIIPVTQKSAGRTGDTTEAHPLCDQIKFLAPYSGKKYQAYVEQLRDWAGSEYGHPKLRPILRYVEKGSIVPDLLKYDLVQVDEKGVPLKEKLVVRWRVLSSDSAGNTDCWKDTTLFQSFIRYYAAKQDEDKVFCMITGGETVPAAQHPKGVISLKGNAKLISANDTSGFTYRGRFTKDWQAATVGYAASQMAHSALRWVAANQGVAFGGRTFLCWNPQGVALPKIHSPLLRRTAETRKPSDYQAALRNTLKGWQEELPKDAAAVVAAFDAATSGRLSLTYYSELRASDFLERLHDWDASCCWWNGPFGVQSPSLFQIVNFAFGTPRTENNETNMETDERIMRQQLQRLLACRVDKGKMPPDIEKALLNRASNLQIFEDGQREALLFTACAVIKKHHLDRYGEEWNMVLEPNRMDSSYQFGRILAIAEKIERDIYNKTGETREPNAIRLQSAFVRRPMHTWCVIQEQLKKAYYPKLKPAERAYYEKLLTEIVTCLSDKDLNKPLGDTYLLGYYLQRGELYTSRKQQNETEE